VEIGRVKAAGETEISFEHERFRALDRIPEELANIPGLIGVILDRTEVKDLTPLTEISGLSWLYLSQTAVTDLYPLAALSSLRKLSLDESNVTDLSPLAGLTGLQDLDLSKSQVTDLRPLLALVSLGSDSPLGLMFNETGATLRDATLAELARIEDPMERAERTRAYLATLPEWPEPYTPSATPDGSPPAPPRERYATPSDLDNGRQTGCSARASGRGRPCRSDPCPSLRSIAPGAGEARPICQPLS